MPKKFPSGIGNDGLRVDESASHQSRPVTLPSHRGQPPILTCGGGFQFLFACFAKFHASWNCSQVLRRRISGSPSRITDVSCAPFMASRSDFALALAASKVLRVAQVIHCPSSSNWIKYFILYVPSLVPCDDRNLPESPKKATTFFNYFHFPIFYKGKNVRFVRVNFPKVFLALLNPSANNFLAFFIIGVLLLCFPLVRSERAKGFYFFENNSCARLFSGLVSPCRGCNRRKILLCVQ